VKRVGDVAEDVVCREQRETLHQAQGGLHAGEVCARRGAESNWGEVTDKYPGADTHCRCAHRRECRIMRERQHNLARCGDEQTAHRVDAGSSTDAASGDEQGDRNSAETLRADDETRGACQMVCVSGSVSS
jgi:hypothetical protein